MILLSNSLTLFYVDQSSISTIIVQMRKNGVKLERVNEFFFKTIARVSNIFLK